jgi:bis(5'-nucleosyl)-tetraphosphatase (symmetrical)
MVNTYAIGDLQGCYTSLQALLKKVDFNRKSDQLWLVGDLVNRGADSLACLRFIRDLGERATLVLGNHDLHLLAIHAGVSRLGKRDTTEAVLNAADGDELLTWLRQQKMLHTAGEYVMVHAGLLPQWSFKKACELAAEIETLLRGPESRKFLKRMYGNDPNVWVDELRGSARHRLVANVLTRMRILDGNNALNLDFKGEYRDIPAGFVPWFNKRHPTFNNKTVLAGHWSGLGLRIEPNFIGLDTGCAWGRELTAIRLADRAVFQVPCAETWIPEGFD